MEKTLRLDPVHRNIAVFALVIIVPLVAGCAYWIESDATAAAKPVFWVLLGLYAAWMILSACWLWLRYRNAWVTIRDGEVVDQGVWRRIRIRLADVEEARWSLSFGGTLRLRTGSERISIMLSPCTTEERRELVRHLHEAIDPARQEGWNLFAYKVTSGYAEDDVRPAKPKEEFRPEDYVLLTRKRWDRLFLVLLVVAMAGISPAAWYFQSSVLLWLVVGWVAVLWLLQRFSTPAEGNLVRKLSAPDRSMEGLYTLAGWSALALVGLVLANVLIRVEWVRAVLMLGFFLTWMFALFRAARRERIEQKRRIHEAADQAAQRRERRPLSPAGAAE